MPRSLHPLRAATVLVLALLTALLAAPGTTHASDLPPDPATSTPSASARVIGWAEAPTTAPTRATYGVRLRVSGGARPVRLERYVGRQWRTVASARSTADGRVSLRWTTPQRRTRVSLRVVVPGPDARPAATTRMRVVKIRKRSAWDDLTPRLKRVHALVNQVRTSGQTCGGTWYPPVRPVRVNAKLNRAAQRFARQMATNDFFSHEGPGGVSAGDRIDASGYDWRSYGENIAGGHQSSEEVIQGWIDSPGHCANMMGDFDELGLGFATRSQSTYQRYWVQDFATR